MLQSLDDLLGLIGRLYPDDLPQPFLLLQGVRRVKAGENAGQVARSVHSTRKRLEALAAAADPVEALFGCNLAPAAEPDTMRRPQGMIGQLLLGELAERAFERIYRETMGTNELILEDAREARNETDYRVLNGQRRPVFRINIKFYGTLFRNARDLVGLDPEDCFALATYKIYQGLQKHESERLPCVFVIVGVPGLTGASVGAAIPQDLAHLVSLVHTASGVPGKRAIEERVVAHLLEADQASLFARSSLASARRSRRPTGTCSRPGARTSCSARSYSTACMRSAFEPSRATTVTPSSICISRWPRTSRRSRLSYRTRVSAAYTGWPWIWRGGWYSRHASTFMTQRSGRTA